MIDQADVSIDQRVIDIIIRGRSVARISCYSETGCTWLCMVCGPSYYNNKFVWIVWLMYGARIAVKLRIWILLNTIE
jgi:hypothetical protein